MKSVVFNIRKYAALLIATSMLLFLSFPGFSQSEPRSSKAEQASFYLQSIEVDPNGVPNSSSWYSQPWIWALVAAFLSLLIPFLLKDYLKRHMESDSESGTGFLD